VEIKAKHLILTAKGAISGWFLGPIILPLIFSSDTYQHEKGALGGGLLFFIVAVSKMSGGGGGFWGDGDGDGSH